MYTMTWMWPSAKCNSQRQLVVRASTLANVSHATGTDFRMLFLYRPAIESLNAGCVHRRSECGAQMDALVANADALIRDVHSVGQERVHCFRYGDLDSMVKALDRVYGPDLYMRDEVENAYHATHDGEKLGHVWASMRRQIGAAALQRVFEADLRLQQACRLTE